jgi:hypothetical protein
MANSEDSAHIPPIRPQTVPRGPNSSGHVGPHPIDVQDLLCALRAIDPTARIATPIHAEITVICDIHFADACAAVLKAWLDTTTALPSTVREGMGGGWGSTAAFFAKWPDRCNSWHPTMPNRCILPRGHIGACETGKGVLLKRWDQARATQQCGPHRRSVFAPVAGLSTQTQHPLTAHTPADFCALMAKPALSTIEATKPSEKSVRRIKTCRR